MNHFMILERQRGFFFLHELLGCGCWSLEGPFGHDANRKLLELLNFFFYVKRFIQLRSLKWALLLGHGPSTIIHFSFNNFIPLLRRLSTYPPCPNNCLYFCLVGPQSGHHSNGPTSITFPGFQHLINVQTTPFHLKIFNNVTIYSLSPPSFY